MATTTEAASNNTENVPSKIIKIQSNDGEIFEIDEDVVEQSSTIKELSGGMFICLRISFQCYYFI
jgi:hypothetical protein